MNKLTPREKDKLLFNGGSVAERRLARGLRLNYPEAAAIISLEIMEGARDDRLSRNSCNWDERC